MSAIDTQSRLQTIHLQAPLLYTILVFTTGERSEQVLEKNHTLIMQMLNFFEYL